MRKGLLLGLLLSIVSAAAWYRQAAQPPASVPAVPAVPAVQAPDPARAALASARAEIIGQKVAALTGTPRKVELTSETALAVHKAIEARDFAAARRITDTVIAGSRLQAFSFYPFNDFMANIVYPASADFEQGLDAWIAESKDYGVSRVIRAYYYNHKAWQARGEHFASATQAAHMQAFAALVAKALADADAALALDKRLPWTHFLKLTILSGHGDSAAMRQAFADGISAFPDYYPLYTMRMRSLEPKWGGSVRELLEFVDTHAGAVDEKSPLKFLYLALYRSLIDVAATTCSSAEAHERQDCTEAVLAKIMPSDIDAQVATAIALHRHIDAYQFSEALSDELGSMLGHSAAKKYTDPVVQMAADALGTENQLMEEHPGRNHYHLDAITAGIWMREGHHDNAETKYQEAIRDMANTRFPGEQEQAVALATLYDELAEVYRAMSQFEDAIAYQRAAGVLGGPPFMRSTVACYSYYRLKDFKAALGECDAVYQRSLEYDALYWRARMEVELKDSDAAIRDFTTIADSEDGWATSAVIELSVLYDRRKDPQAALTVFEKHPFVFDEENRSKRDLAVVYNNRCYAYKELGQLDKALSDCNTSLKFGDIPDARQKKRDLEKRIKARETRA